MKSPVIVNKSVDTPLRSLVWIQTLPTDSHFDFTSFSDVSNVDSSMGAAVHLARNPIVHNCFVGPVFEKIIRNIA